MLLDYSETGRNDISQVLSSSGPGLKSISKSIQISTSRSLSKSDLDLELRAIIAMPPPENFLSKGPSIKLD